MENKIDPQLELFAQATAAGIRKTRGNNLFLTRIRNYEKIILIIMGIAVTCIISFSLGIEKGKSISLSKPVITAPAERNQVITREKIKDNKLIREENVTIKDAAPSQEQYFVIQLASFKNKSLAVKEAQQLKKQGFASILIPKGTYSVLCVGNFADRQKALSLQSELKKQYKDCYVRRL